MSIWELIFVLFGLIVLGYFLIRGIRLARISGFYFYLSAEVVEFVLPAMLVFVQSFIVEMSGIDNPWKSYLAVVLVIVAGALNTVGRQKRKSWEQNAQGMYSDKWSRWLRRLDQASVCKPVDRLFRYTSIDQHPQANKH